MAGKLRFYLDLKADRNLRINLSTDPAQSGFGYSTDQNRVYQSSKEILWADSDRHYFLNEEDQKAVLGVIRQYLINKAKEEGRL